MGNIGEVGLGDIDYSKNTVRLDRADWFTIECGDYYGFKIHIEENHGDARQYMITILGAGGIGNNIVITQHGSNEL